MRHLKYILFAGLLAWGCVKGIVLLRAADVLYAISPKPDPPLIALYSRLFSDATTRDDLVIPGSLGPIHLRVYTPAKVKSPATILLVHGFAPLGDQHPVLNSLALRLARIGFRVVAPTVPAETGYEMRASDLTVIGEAIRWSASTYGEKISVMGISFGGGLAIAAAGQPDVAPDVKLIFSVSSYDDLYRIDHYYIHEQVFAPDGQPFPGRGPKSGPLLFISQYLDEIVSPADVAAFRPLLEKFKDNVSNRLPPEQNLDYSHLTPAQRALFDEIQSVDTPEMRRLCRAVLERHKAEIERISPSTVLPQLKIPLYVMHGSHDTSLPPAEFEWTVHDSRNNPDAHFLLTPWITHANIGGFASIFDKIRAGLFFAQVLDRAAKS